MKADNKISILVISNLQTNSEIFRVHIHEKSIRFDEQFAQGINSLPQLKKDVEKINELYSSKELKSEDIFGHMIKLMFRYHNHLKKYYFTEDQLDEEGHYKSSDSEDETEYYEQEEKQTMEDKFQDSDAQLRDLNNGLPVNPPSKAALHFLYLKQNKKLKRISRKEFEKSINSEDIANFYVDNYVKKGVLFYKFEKPPIGNIKKVWYFMVVNKEFKISFTSEQ